jgi:hypothetical protein
MATFILEKLSSKIRNILIKGSFYITNYFLLILIMVINSVNAEDQKKARDQGKIVITEEDINLLIVQLIGAWYL